jgi:hypothetical protein
MKLLHRTPQRKALYVALGACFSAGVAANPNGAVVVGGSASFVQSGDAADQLRRAIINWQGFDWRRRVHALHPVRHVSCLNRVRQRARTSGQLLSTAGFPAQSNGYHGGGAVVDVAALLLRRSGWMPISSPADSNSTMSCAGRIVNDGTIRTPEGGKVYLVAPNVENNGLITSPGGEIILAAGRKIELVSAASPDVRVELSAPQDSVLNVGEVIAEAGQVGIFGTTVRNAGTVSADGARRDASGRIFFVARDVVLDAGSTVSANGPAGGLVRIEARGGTLVFRRSDRRWFKCEVAISR